MNSRKVFNRIGLAMASLTILVNIIQFLLQSLFSKYIPSIIDSSWYSFILLGVSFYLIGFPLIRFVLKSLPNSEPIESKKLSFQEIMILFFISYSLMVIVNLLTMGALQFFSYINGNNIFNPIKNVVSHSSALGTFLFIGIFSPIIEEILFRGILLNKLRCYGDKIALITTALLFGLFHGNFAQFFYAFVLGLVFGYVTLKCGTIKYSIILHIMVNLIGSFIASLVANNIMLTVIFGLFILLVVICGFILFIKNIKTLSFSPASTEIQKGTIFKTTCLNFGMILNFLINISLIIFSLFL